MMPDFSYTPTSTPRPGKKVNAQLSIILKKAYFFGIFLFLISKLKIYQFGNCLGPGCGDIFDLIIFAYYSPAETILYLVEGKIFSMPVNGLVIRLTHNILRNLLMVIQNIAFIFLALSFFEKIQKRKLPGRFHGYFLIYVLFIMTTICFSASAIEDTNPGNNGLEKNVVVTSTRNISIRFVPYLLAGQSDSLIFSASFINAMAVYINKTYPLADDGLRISVDQNPIQSSGDNKLGPESTFFTLRNNLGLYSEDYVVGLVSERFFPHFGETGTKGYTGGLSLDTVIVEETWLPGPIHEIGHLPQFDLCDEYNETKWNYSNQFETVGGCPNGDRNRNNLLDQDCYNESALGCLISNTSLLKNLSLLFPQPIQNGTYRNMMGNQFYTWVDNLSYSRLIAKINSPHPSMVGRKLLFFVRKQQGIFSILESYIVETTRITNQSSYIPGNVSIISRDQNGNVLFNLSINFSNTHLHFQGGGGDDENISFFLSIPFENLSRVSIIEANQTQFERNRSANAPNLSIISNFNGATIQTGNLISISWNSTDIDNDNVSSAVLISHDNGSSFVPVSSGISNLTLTFNSSPYTESQNYRIQLYSSDGLNSANITSNFTFLLRNPPSVTNLSLLSIINSSIYTFEINASSIFNFSNISWTFKAGENVSINSTIQTNLTSTTEVIVFVQVNTTIENFSETNATARSENLTGFTYLRFGSSANLNITNFSILAFALFNRTFETVIMNPNADAKLLSNWSIDTGDANISSSLGYNLSANQTIVVFAAHNFSKFGRFNSVASANTNEATKTVVTRATEFLITNLSSLVSSGVNRTFELIIQNIWNAQTNGNWTLDVGVENITSDQEISVGVGRNVSIFTAYDYASSQNRTIIARIKTNQSNDTLTINI